MKAFNKKRKPKHMTKSKWIVFENSAGLVQRRTKKFVQYLSGIRCFGYIPKYRDRRIQILQMERKKVKAVAECKQNT